MKTKNSIRNSIVSLIMNITLIIINFISQSIFIKVLGQEYLGLNSLFSNIISMLSILDLGIGSAIIYNLYRPLKDKDIETINSLMKFYKKAYNIISLLVFIIGILILPFLKFFIKEVTIPINVNIIYLLFIIDTVSTYLLSYKRSILYADQKNYLVNIVHISSISILTVSQILILYLTKNYYLYLILKIITHIAENIIISKLANKYYPFINKPAKNLDKLIEKDIFKKVKAMIFHKVGAFVVSGSDNLIISRYFGLSLVGMYSNYYMIINAVSTLFGQALSALTPSIGLLLTEKDKNKNYEIFKKTRFLNFWITTFTGTSILVIIDSFITIWIGEKYILDGLVLFTLIANYYQTSMRTSFSVFKEAAGIYYEDRFVPLIESAINIIFSLILLRYFGLAGVFMGTIISGLTLWLYSYPKLVYKNLFERNYTSYIKETLGYIILFILISSLTFFISNIIRFNNFYLKFVTNIAISIIVPNVILLIIFFRNDNFKYYFRLIQKAFKRTNL